MSSTLEPSLTPTPAPDLAPLENPTTFEAVLAAQGDLPAWVVAQKREAWTRFRELAMPTRLIESWRFGNLRGLDGFAQYAPADGAIDATLRQQIIGCSTQVKAVSGRIVLADDQVLVSEISEEAQAAGVVFLPLAEAFAQHPDLVKETFMTQSPELGSEKFEALHVAMLRNGIFLHVPPNVELSAPFLAHHWTVAADRAVFPHTLFVCGDNAEANLIEFQNGATPDTAHFVVANSHVYAGAGSRPKHKIVQNWNRETLAFQLNTSNAQRDVASKGIIINVGGKQVRQEIHGKIFGEGSDVNIYSLSVPTGEQEFDQRTLQTHDAANSRSNLLFKNALLDDSKTIFSGLIIVEPDAQQTDAYQTNNNLMLSDTAESNSLPGLEIQANDVKCSHGATTGRIDDTNIFYFLARGIPRKKAEELMVFGFFEEIVEKFDNDELAELVRDLVQAKFH